MDLKCTLDKLRAQEPLVDSLLFDPTEFRDAGRANDLLQRYFRDLDVASLRSLLTHPDDRIKREAVWIASELGVKASPLVKIALQLADNEDTYIAYHALEIVGVCATVSPYECVSTVARGLELSDPVLRSVSMRLLSNLDASVLASAVQEKPETVLSRHQEGLAYLVRLSQSDNSQYLSRPLKNHSREDHKLWVRYRLIAERRAFSRSLSYLLSAMGDDAEEIKKIATEALSQAKRRLE